MALGFGNKREGEVTDAPPLSTTTATADRPMMEDAGYSSQSAGWDAEKQQQESQRRMSRIDKPVGKPIAAGQGEGDLSDDASGVSIGKQMELEAGNAIKYRTCSWPKV